VRTPRAKIALWLVLMALAVVSVHRLVCAAPRRTPEVFEGPTMGTTRSAKLVAGRLESEERARIREVIRLRRSPLRPTPWRCSAWRSK
jgi:hypothetical protein